jgi:TonB family protein
MSRSAGFRPLSTAVVLLLAAAVAPLQLQASNELEQHLRDQYNGKTLVLRNFYHGDHLNYDSAGVLTGSGVTGDWTVDGFVRVTALSLSDARLTVHADRLPLGNCGKGCGFRPYTDKNKNNKKDKNEKKLRLEILFNHGALTPAQADAALSAIFLTDRDRITEDVPAYWKPCVFAASTGIGRNKYSACSFPPELATIPGLVSVPDETPEHATGDATASDNVITVKTKGVIPPKPAFTPDPPFSDSARQAHYQGTAVLSIIVDKTGQVQNIRIWQPLGFGLDQKAVETVSKWLFKPGTKDGQPVDMEVAVEVDFHLY